MASAVDICNLALAHLGDDATVSSISPPEGSAQAEACARFYPIARDVMLEMHAWNFATRRQELSQVTNTLNNWAFAYALPADCLKPLNPFNSTMREDDETAEYIIETDASNVMFMYTNVPEASLRYVRKVTDTTRFSPLFVNALSWLLASYLAGPIVKDPRMKESCYRMFITEANKAMVADAQARKRNTLSMHRPDWIQEREAIIARNESWVDRS